jgi:3-isopropylmalate dehydrogenase
MDPFRKEIGGKIGMNNRSNMIKVAVVGGEGIGPEVTAQSHRVLNWFAARRNVPVELREAQFGLIPYRATGKVLPPDTVEAMDQAEAILWGATGGPETTEVPAEARKAGSLLSLRSKYDLYANLRPIVANPALAESAPLKARVLKGVDFIIIRELTSGIYFGEPRGIETLADGQRRGFNTEQYTTSQVRRVARAAFELARTRKGRVCSVDKANVLETSVLWREEVIALHAEEFSDVELSHLYVDNAAMQIVREPSQFDVMVTGNIFGDILSDCAAMASGSLGMLPSASLGPVDRFGRRKALYEPVHGSAPDIAGKGIANPLGSILSVAMMLRLTLDRPDDADLLEQAVDLALAAGARTADIAEPGAARLSTEQMGDAVLNALDKVAGKERVPA